MNTYIKYYLSKAMIVLIWYYKFASTQTSCDWDAILIQVLTKCPPKRILGDPEAAQKHGPGFAYTF